ncbi:YadA-like family protein [Dyella sp. GSA-30]|uniref:YadA-like family protein n=1 Tax=Dyella sp. GSA-30 TaxID=2994496 RepID=UPI002492B698|nr:YadA-like family protein [Dyella sp. GSA-30]BDU22158.1 hypothetical protein DYGSA30_36150 [Dyella sp. GSA-30]
MNTADTASTGTAATLDDAYIKIRGATAATASGTNSMAMGNAAQANGSNAIALGAAANAKGQDTIAMGSGASAQITNAVAIGRYAASTGGNAVAVGHMAKAYGTNSTAVGEGANAFGIQSTALGMLASATGLGSNALGTKANASGYAGVAIGAVAVASGANSVALGLRAAAPNDNSVALGSSSVTDRDNSVSVGAAGAERQITNVADGTQDTDAINLRQLKSAGLVGSDGSVLDAVSYAIGSNRSLIALSGAMGTRITNVMAGSIAPGSMDAVNGGELWDVQDQVNRLGDRLTTVEAGGQVAPIGPVTGAPVTDNGDQVIGHVGDGVAVSDAATVGQVTQQTQQAIETAKTYTDTQVGAVNQRLDQFQTSVDRRFQQQDRRISRVGSMSMAQSQMAANMAGLSGQNRVGVGVGNQSGQAALAVGFQRALSNNRASISVGASASGSETSVGMGGGVSW